MQLPLVQANFPERNEYELVKKPWKTSLKKGKKHITIRIILVAKLIKLQS